MKPIRPHTSRYVLYASIYASPMQKCALEGAFTVHRIVNSSKRTHLALELTLFGGYSMPTKEETIYKRGDVRARADGRWTRTRMQRCRFTVARASIWEVTQLLRSTGV